MMGAKGKKPAGGKGHGRIGGRADGIGFSDSPIHPFTDSPIHLFTDSPIHRPFSGFTLVELLVVMIIMAVVIAMTVPRIGANWKQIQDSDFLEQLTGSIQRSRLFAMNSGMPVSFRLNGTSRVYGAENPPAHAIPLNVEIFAKNLEADPESGDFLITFYPDGSPVGDNLEVVFDNSRTYDVVINPLFGTVGVEKK